MIRFSMSRTPIRLGSLAGVILTTQLQVIAFSKKTSSSRDYIYLFIYLFLIFIYF